MNKILILVFLLVFLFFLYWTVKKNDNDCKNKIKKIDYRDQRYFLATLTIAKNESMIIQEFIDHYKSQGVSHMFIIDNGSTDNTNEILQQYDGFVTVFQLPEPHKQIDHYNKVYKEIKDYCEWLAVVDVDEYIFGVEDNIEDLLKYDKDFMNVDYIVLPWIMFGSSGYVSQPKNIRKSFIKRKSLEECASNPKFNNQKSLFKTKHVDRLNIHTHDIINKNITNIIDAPINKIRLNHYPIMSWEYFSKVKMTRGDSNNPLVDSIRDKTYFDIYDSDTDIYDTALSDICIYTNPSIESFYTLSEPKVIYQNTEPATSLDIVVAYYNMSLDWLFDILKNFPRHSFRVFLYAKKSSDNVKIFEKYVHKLIELKNIGRCDHTYVYHIIDNYESKMSKTTLFIKDSSLRHDHEINNGVKKWIVNNIEHIVLQTQPSIVFEGVGLMKRNETLYNWVLDKYIQEHDQNFNQDPFITAPKFLRPIQNWAKNILDDEEFDISGISWVSYYGIFFVNSENIKITPLKTWIRAGVSLSLGPNLEIGHYMERFWFYLLNKKEKNNSSTNKPGM